MEEESKEGVECLAGEMAPAEGQGLLEVKKVEEKLAVAVEVLFESGRDKFRYQASLIAKVEL